MAGMTNALMGVLGTAVIVGSAAAGTNYIGSGPEQAGVSTSAAAVISSLTQTTGAVVTGRVLHGGVASGPAGIHDLVRQGYLASLPTNPTTDAEEGLASLQPARGPNGLTTEIIQMRLANDEKGQAVCDEVAKQATGNPAPTGNVFPLSALSCVNTPAGPIAFSRV